MGSFSTTLIVHNPLPDVSKVFAYVSPKQANVY